MESKSEDSEDLMMEPEEIPLQGLDEDNTGRFLTCSVELENLEKGAMLVYSKRSTEFEWYLKSENITKDFEVLVDKANDTSEII